MNRRGFTITELLIVIVVMGILLTLGVVGLRGSQLSSRDNERKSDIDALALHLESYYSNGNDALTTTYPSTALTTAVTIDSVHTFLRDIDLKAITAPGITDPAITLISATCTGVCVQTPGSATTSPTFDQYMYQPLKSDGSLCTNSAQECVEFNLYYRLETDNTVYMVTSRHQ